MNEELFAASNQLSLIHYHEAGHIAADYLLGFKPKSIKQNLSEHDRRTTSFFRTNMGLLTTPRARERAQDFAVTCIAGIVAESKYAEVPISELKHTAGFEDYKKVRAIAGRLMLHRPLERSEELIESYVSVWEARAIALLNQPAAWSIVENIVSALEESWDSSLKREEIEATIEYGLAEVSYLERQGLVVSDAN